MPEPEVATSGEASTRSTATPARARRIAVAAPAAPPPTTRAFWIHHFTAIGLTGEPTAPVIRSGAAVRKNS